MKQDQFVIVARHGLTLPNLLLEQPTEGFYYEITGADEKIGLTPLGFIQVDDATTFCSRFLGAIRIDRIYSSQFLRSIQTAQSAQKALPNQPPIVQDERIAKRHYGAFWNITYAGVQALYPEEYLKFKRLGGYLYRPPQGENYSDLKKRILSFKRDMIDATDENIYISTHSAAALTFEQVFLEEMTDHELVARYDAVGVPNASIAVYKRVAATRRIFGLRVNFVGWCKRLIGLRHETWTRVMSYAPPSALDGSLDATAVEGAYDMDTTIDKEDRVA